MDRPGHRLGGTGPRQARLDSHLEGFGTLFLTVHDDRQGGMSSGWIHCLPPPPFPVLPNRASNCLVLRPAQRTTVYENEKCSDGKDILLRQRFILFCIPLVADSVENWEFPVSSVFWVRLPTRGQSERCQELFKDGERTYRLKQR